MSYKVPTGVFFSLAMALSPALIGCAGQQHVAPSPAAKPALAQGESNQELVATAEPQASEPSAEPATQSEEATFFALRGPLHMMTYSYPNMAMSVGEDGILVVDANLEKNGQIVFDAIAKEFAGAPVTYVVNTHFHGDHTGGNLTFMKSGAVAIVQENGFQAMTREYYVNDKGEEFAAGQGKGMRDYTEGDIASMVRFSERMGLHFNGETIDILHVEDAHTEGDLIVHFKTSNVIALGDNYFGNAYTFGRNFLGMIAVYKKVLGMIDDDTIIVPGHGVPSSKRELQQYLDMALDVKRQVDREKARGKTLEEVEANESITKKYDEKYGKLYIDGPRFRNFVYQGTNRNWTR